jgi:hypothetical protein
VKIMMQVLFFEGVRCCRVAGGARRLGGRHERRGRREPHACQTPALLACAD